MKKNISFIILHLFFTSIIMSQTKDTLFFKIDNKYLYQSQYDSEKYMIKDNDDVKTGAIYFKEFKIINNAKPKKILCFKKFAQSSKLYSKNNKKKLNDFKTLSLFDLYTVILINKNNEYIQVGPVYVTE